MIGFIIRTLLGRFVCLAVLLVAEVTALSVWVDNDTLARTGHLLPLLHDWGPAVVRGAIAFAAVFLTFALLKCRAALERVALFPIQPWWLAAHALLALGFVWASKHLYSGRLLDFNPDLLVAAWAATGLAAAALAALAFLTVKTWRQILDATGSLWAVALATALVASFFTRPARSLWEPATRLTFAMVKFMLSWVLPEATAVAEKATIHAPHFSVIIAPECSGLEGAALIMVFTIAWLWLFRQESRFPWALALLPAGVVVLFVLNAVRLTALVWIGNAGAQKIAAGGFHSQAGWISFNAVAFGLSVVARRSPWFSMRTKHVEPSRTTEDATGAFLIPFLAILGTGMLARAASAGFESLYPLRLLAAGVALWTLRRSYRDCDWRFGWAAPAAGVGVFVLWVGLERILGNASSSSPIPAALDAMSLPARIFWLTARVLAASITVPIAEELAFRGYLMRRLVAADFERVDPRRVTWFSLAVSSIVFGAMHGSSWLAGSASGLVYGWLYARRGRLGDPVVAHGSTNILLAVCVLAFRQWQLW
ncbi:MAG TPA: exosortase E/protease, VPEID-CTERM system [Bryobacteraceae bacterium]|nr:exosortase E/protease, VPEID-CTERM system [Bryobacteraceae bacterium]